MPRSIFFAAQMAARSPTSVLPFVRQQLVQLASPPRQPVPTRIIRSLLKQTTRALSTTSVVQASDAPKLSADILFNSAKLVMNKQVTEPLQLPAGTIAKILNTTLLHQPNTIKQLHHMFYATGELYRKGHVVGQLDARGCINPVLGHWLKSKERHPRQVDVIFEGLRKVALTSGITGNLCHSTISKLITKNLKDPRTSPAQNSNALYSLAFLRHKTCLNKAFYNKALLDTLLTSVNANAADYSSGPAQQLLIGAAQIDMHLYDRLAEILLPKLGSQTPEPSAVQVGLAKALEAISAVTSVEMEAAYGPYFVDLKVILRSGHVIIIELDGFRQHYNDEGKLRDKDQMRDQWLKHNFPVQIQRYFRTKGEDDLVFIQRITDSMMPTVRELRFGDIGKKRRLTLAKETPTFFKPAEESAAAAVMTTPAPQQA